MSTSSNSGTDGDADASLKGVGGDGPSASTKPTASRRLRARRPPPPRLLDHGESGTQETPELRLGTGDGPPITFMRLGRSDLESGLRAVGQGARPTAIVTGLGESRDTTARARRLTREHNIPWLNDPLLFRTGLSGYRTATTLQTLDYAPGRDADPYQPTEFEDGELARHVGRSVVGAQMDLGASGALSGAFVIDAIDDPWMAVNQHLLRVGADAATAWNAPMVATLPLRLRGFEQIEAQRVLVRALSARRPGAWLLMADGLSEDSSPQRIVSALRLALLIQANGVPVILGRAGDLRALFLAFGVGGAEFGLGRLLRFAVPDFTKTGGGPGPTPGPRVELPSLCCAVGFERARQLLGAELVEEAACTCPSCTRAPSIVQRLATVAEHDAHVVIGGAAALAGQPTSERVATLDARLGEAIARWRRLELHGMRMGRPERLQRLRRALHDGVQAGLLEPARLAAELRLLD